MDHKNFETHMIDFVNRKAQAEEDARNEILREQQVSVAHQKRQKATKAVVEYFVWVVALIGIVIAMSFAYQIHYVPAKVAILTSSTFAFIAGVRINTLAVRITKYGGR